MMNNLYTYCDDFKKKCYKECYRVCYNAVGEGSSLKDVPIEYRDYGICYKAIEANPLDIEHVPFASLNRAMIQYAIMLNGGNENEILDLIPKDSMLNMPLCKAGNYPHDILLAHVYHDKKHAGFSPTQMISCDDICDKDELDRKMNEHLDNYTKSHKDDNNYDEMMKPFILAKTTDSIFKSLK